MSSTISEQICEQLASEILSGEIALGQKLDEQVIANKFSVSRTPVRDALRQLSATGLIEFKPRRGATVVDIGFEQLNEMFEAQSELEALCAKLSAQRMTAMERKKLSGIHEDAAVAMNKNDAAAYSRLNEEMHALLFQGAHNDSIKALTIGFRQRLAPFRLPMFYESPGRLEKSFTEHEDIVAAILANDAEKAHAAMTNHVLRTSLNVIEHFLQSKKS